MTTIWDRFSSDHYLSLAPWTWVQFESSESPGPLPHMAGIDPAVVAALHEVHGILLSAVETAISDVFSRRASLDDPAQVRRLEDAYAEVVSLRPHLREHITCGRRPDGTFQWEFRHDPQKSAVATYAGLRIFNAVARQATPFSFERPIAPAVGKFLGYLTGVHTAAELRTIAMASGRDLERQLTKLFELLVSSGCVNAAPRSTVEAQWLASTGDQETVHLGHAALLYRQQQRFFLFDPWLMPWFAEAPVPSLWGSLLPAPAAIFLTHDHDDHVDPRTLVHMPKDTPVIVPSRRNRRTLYYDYLSLLRQLGFSNIIELAHGEAWKFEGGAVYAVPFFGEDPCDLEMPRNCYLIVDRGRNVLVHADSGPTNAGKSAVTQGLIDELVQRHGPLETVFASQQQLKEIRTYAAHACLAHPGTWLQCGENGFLTNTYLTELCARAQARQFVSYATGGADWYPDHLSFMFSHRNPARTALLTANWEPPAQLGDLLRPLGCTYHVGQAFDRFASPDLGSSPVANARESLDPVKLYSLDHGTPAFLQGRS